MVTGLGSVSPWGWTVGDLQHGLMSGATALAEARTFNTLGHRTRVAGEVGAAPDALTATVPNWSRLSRAEHFALGAASEAVAMAELELPRALPEPAMGVFFGGSTAGMAEAEEFFRRLKGVSYGLPRLHLLAAHQLNGPGDAVARHLNLCGPVETFSAACASGGLAVAAALESLRTGEVEVALAGASDALCQLTYAGFNSLRAVAESPCRPFREDREGLSIGEGAGVLVLERLSHARRRGVRALAVLLGAGTTCDAHHMTAPHPQGEGAARAIASALEDAALEPGEVTFVNAHGTGTLQNDAAEHAALAQVFKERTADIPLTSSKGAVGHLLGSSGAIEAVATVLCLQQRAVHPTPGGGPADPALGVHLVVDKPWPLAKPAVAISTSLAFGGANAVLVLADASHPRGMAEGEG